MSTSKKIKANKIKIRHVADLNELKLSLYTFFILLILYVYMHRKHNQCS